MSRFTKSVLLLVAWLLSTYGSSASAQSEIELPELPDAQPWSDAPVLDDPDRFQIGIMTDRTGGHRVGVWMEGVRALNHLRPDFVMSVGDLIDGSSRDREGLEREWQEFLGFIDQLDMRFFFVAGNHDLSNNAPDKLSYTIWREKFGPYWYSFDYKGVHFVALNSEDPRFRIGDEQLEWLRRDLEEHRDARWTLVFLHKPLWVYSERARQAGNVDETQWPEVEKLLVDRPHTVFSGHVHHYVQYKRNGRDYYHLATTGGGSALRGLLYGEFDHVTWLTMESDGPHVTQVLLSGVLAPDVVTETSISRFRSFLENVRVEVSPVLVDPETPAPRFDSGIFEVRLHNQHTEPVLIDGSPLGLPLRGLSVTPEKILLRADPGETTTLALSVSFSEPVDLEHLQRSTLELEVVETPSAGSRVVKPLRAMRAVPITIDRSFECQPVQSKTLDGDFSDWQTLRHQLGERLMPSRRSGPGGQWNGPGDGSMRFDVACDDEALYFAFDVLDDSLDVGRDRVELLLDVRPLGRRLSNTWVRTYDDVFRLRPRAQSQDGMFRPNLRSRGNEAAAEAREAFYRRTETGYRIELRIPISVVTHLQGQNWHSLQFDVALRDTDDSIEEPLLLTWRGEPGWYDNFGFAHLSRSGSSTTP